MRYVTISFVLQSGICSFLKSKIGKLLSWQTADTKAVASPYDAVGSSGLARLHVAAKENDTAQIAMVLQRGAGNFNIGNVFLSSPLNNTFNVKCSLFRNKRLALFYSSLSIVLSIIILDCT